MFSHSMTIGKVYMYTYLVLYNFLMLSEVLWLATSCWKKDELCVVLISVALHEKNLCHLSVQPPCLKHLLLLQLQRLLTCSQQ